jgi:hypothetical protein
LDGSHGATVCSVADPRGSSDGILGEPIGKELGLSLETAEGGIVPDDMMSSVNFFGEIQLRFNDFKGEDFF